MEIVNYILKNDKRIFVAFFIVALILRLGTLIPTLINPDESTYLVMAHQMLNGDLLYVDTIDIKPFGIYVFFAALLSISKSIMLIRFSAITLIAISAYCLYRVKETFTEDKGLRFTVGLAYVAMTSAAFVFEFNTEFLYVTFTVVGLFLFTLKNWRRYSLLAGVVFGLGFMTKYLVVFDVVAIYTFFFFYRVYVTKEVSWLKFIKYSALSFVGFLIPFWGAHFYYYAIGHYKEFHFVTYVLPFNYQGEKDVFADLDFMSGIHQRYIPFMIVFYLSLLNFKSFNSKHKAEKVFVLIWFLLALFSIYFPGAHYRHYYLQAVPAIAFLVPNIFFENKWLKSQLIKPVPFSLAVSTLGIIAIMYSGYWTKHYLEKPDKPKEIVAFLKPLLKAEDKVFVMTPHITQLLLDKKSPTHYVHPSLMINRTDKFEIDVVSECDWIFKENPPNYWVREENEPCDPFLWKENYVLIKDFNNGVLVYKLRD